MKNAGFTLIELIVVVSILAVLSTLGIAAFVNYSRVQALNAAASDVVTTLQNAKSRAQSQFRPNLGICSGVPLKGYKVIICSGGCAVQQLYEIGVVCENNDYHRIGEQKSLPQNITFTNPTVETPFTFKLLTGGVEGAASGGTPIVVNGYGQTKIITVYSDGRVVSQ